MSKPQRGKVINEKLVYRGRTLAYRRFGESQARTRSLLDAGLVGLTEKGRKLEEVRAKFDGIKVPRGRVPKDYNPKISGRRTEDNNIELTLDERVAHMLRTVMARAVGQHKSLRFHYYSILAVYVWGMYETYLTMLFEELYSKRKQLLISNETLSYRDAIEKGDGLVAHLIEQQLEKLGRMGLSETSKYVNDRLNFSLSAGTQRALAGYFLVRNIIAHNTGIVRKHQVSSLPKGVTVEANELRVTKAFLTRMLGYVERVVTSVERHVDAKFCGVSSQGHG